MVQVEQGSGAKRLVATVACLYHNRGLKQHAIAERLGISQSRVLDQAITLGIVRTSVVFPVDEQSVLERELETTYGLRSAHVYAIGNVQDENQLVGELGQLLALQLQSAPLDAEVIGFTPWSRTLQQMVGQLPPAAQSGTRFVVEMVGDLGPPVLQHLAAQNTQQLATMTGAQPVFLRLPGVLPSREVKQTLLSLDPHARDALAKLDHIDLALTGFGNGNIVAPLRAGDNLFTADPQGVHPARAPVDRRRVPQPAPGDARAVRPRRADER